MIEDIKFKSLEELYMRIRPALISKAFFLFLKLCDILDCLIIDFIYNYFFEYLKRNSFSSLERAS